MNVFVLIVTHPYEFSECVGVFKSIEDAETKKTSCKADDASNGYDEYEIEEFQVE